MSEQEILECNKLIAEFMGYRVFNKRYPRNHGIGAPEIYHKDVILEKCKYHISFDCLIHVVEKIESLGYFHSVNKNSSSFSSGDKSCFFSEFHDINYKTVDGTFGSKPNRLNAIYRSVVEFIKWYNQNRQL